MIDVTTGEESDDVEVIPEELGRMTRYYQTVAAILGVTEFSSTDAMHIYTLYMGQMNQKLMIEREDALLKRATDPLNRHPMMGGYTGKLDG